MNEPILLTLESVADIEEIENKIHCIPGIEVKNKNTQKGINGIDNLMYLLSIGGGVVIVELSNLIKNLISKNNCKKVKIDDIEITGFSTDETIDLLKEIIALKNKEKQNKSEGE